MASIVHTSVGSFIPASQRADGTWRKQRRVKDGYTPQDEVPLYESRGKQWAKGRSQYPPGLDPELIKAKEEAAAAQEVKKSNKKKKAGQPGILVIQSSSSSQPSSTPAGAEKKQKPEAKSSPAPPVKVEEKWETVKSRGVSKGKKEPGATQPKQEGQPATKGKQKESKQPQQQQPQPQQQCEAIEPVKRLRNLRKKLKEIEALEEKINSKELKNPDKDQLSKVKRKDEIEAAILALEVEVSMGLK